jgi:type IV secretory pathway VirB10-like protein
MTNEPMKVPGITDKRIIPPGILPKNFQHVALGGLAVVMMIVIFFSGRSNPKPHTSTTPPVESPVQTPNGERLNDYRRRIEEESNKLALEQAELTRSKGALERKVNQQMVGQGQQGPATNSYGPYSANPQSAEEPSQSNWIAQEKAKREYTSRFASNFALTLRGDQKPASSDMAIQPGQALPPLDPRLYSWPVMPPPATQLPQPTIESQLANAKPVEQSGHQAKSTLPDLNRSEGKQYRLFEGTIIETALTNRLDGSFSGPVNCLVSYDVFSHDRNHILIPSGSRVLGDVHSVDSSGQSRLAVAFHRLVMPDGFSVNLDQFRGLDQVGETGLRDQVNHHYLQIFGASIAIGMIAGLAQANTNYGTSESATDAYRQGVASSLSQSSTHILDKFLNILPTFTIREGQRIKIYLQEDLELPAYENHKIPDDI